MLYNIYVYELKDGKQLLYPRVSLDNDVFGMNECAFVYQEIVRKNPIVRVNHIQEGVESWQIDTYVHTYMRKYGLENVRGGRYDTLELSESAKSEISEAIKFFSCTLEEQDHRVYQYHDCRKNIQYDIDYYRKKISLYEQTDAERKKYEIDRTIRYDLNWLNRIVAKGGNNFFDIKGNYDKLMTNLAAVYQQYLNVEEDARTKIDSIHELYGNCAKCELFFQNPRLFFDSRVIQEERHHSKYDYESDTKFKCVLSVFELAIYSLINREDELIFDLNQFLIQEYRDKLFILEYQLGERSIKRSDASLNDASLNDASLTPSQ
jgi:hypothetical protein